MRIPAVFFLLFCCMAVTAFSQNAVPYGINNVEQSDGGIIITYFHTPIGDDADAEYEVSMYLTRESDKNFRVEMKNATGDIGDGKYVGKNRKIVWASQKQFPKGLPFDDIEFELTITKNEGMPGWVWYTGGAAIVGAGTFLLLAKPKDEVPGSTTLPGPPSGRPN